MKKWAKRLIYTSGVAFTTVNIVAGFHAYKFTHFSTEKKNKINANRLSISDKIKLVFTGVSLPRPRTKKRPKYPFENITIQSNVSLSGWLMKAPERRGTVILFHGYGGEKSDMLTRAYGFLDLGYNTLLVDFMGAAASESNDCTIGFKEAENVKSCIEYIRKTEKENTIYLMGVSLGAAAVLKYINDSQDANIKGLVLECPFGSMMQTVKNRFELMNAPAFPMANLLVFWGGTLNGFNAFNHNPEDYAQQTTIPTLLMYGEKDDRVKRLEIDNIFHNLKGEKTLVTFPNAGHESYVDVDSIRWINAVKTFMFK